MNYGLLKKMRNYYNQKKMEDFVVLDDPYNSDISKL
jgi:hypothetical protein